MENCQGKLIYLDSAADYPVLPCARDAFLNAPPGNPGSAHACGRAARAALEAARETIARCINAGAEEIFFCSGATEACGWAMKCVSRSCGELVMDRAEHHAVSRALLDPPRDPFGTGFVRMLANNETGEIFPMPARQTPRDLIFTDATAAVGHMPVDFEALGVDYMACSAHKFGGYPGVGVLVVKTGAPFTPLLRGGGQERGRRAGTESVALACAMAAALEWQCGGIAKTAEHMRACADAMIQRLRRIEGFHLNRRDGAAHLGHILNIGFGGVSGRTLTQVLSERFGVMASAGAACTSADPQPSAALMELYGDPARAAEGIRISFSHDTTPCECAHAASAIAYAVALLRRM